MTGESSVPTPGDAVQRERARMPATPAETALIHRRALLAARAAADVKAEDVRLLEMRDLVTYTDYLVICTGRNTRLAKRICEEVGFRLKQEGVLPRGIEGGAGGDWILMDYLDFVVHIFTPQAREFYRLEALWKQAPIEAVD